RSALSCALAVTGHGSAPALASLPVAGVTAAPAAVLAQRHPVGVVALALVRLVVAVLALLAREGDCYPNVSAGHGQKSQLGCTKQRQTKEKPRPARGEQSLARPRASRIGPDGGPI